MVSPTPFHCVLRLDEVFGSRELVWLQFGLVVVVLVDLLAVGFGVKLWVC